MPNPSPPARQRRKQARPAEIIEAALLLFHQKGYSATKLDDVARAAGVTKGTLYLYFPSKEALFKAAILETIQPNLERIEEYALLSQAPASQRLKEALSSWASSMDACKGSIAKLMIAEAGNFPELSQFYIETVVKRSRQLLTTLIQAGIDSGEFRPVNADMLARTLFAPMLLSSIWRHTYASLDPIPYDLNQLNDFHLDILFQGITLSEQS